MLKINIHVNDETRKEIKDVYDNDDYETVNSVVHNIIERYLGIEYFNPELPNDEVGDYQMCEACGEKSKHSRMIDVDGTNIEEYDVCENCGSGYPALI